MGRAAPILENVHMIRANPSPCVLINASSLQHLLHEATPPVVLDASFDLTDPDAGRRSFESAHVPGAHYVHLDLDLCGPKTGRNGRHPMPSRMAFATTLARLGLQPSQTVVVMDRGNSIFAARLWWMLGWIGHPTTRVLDGGWAAWQAQGGEVATGPSPQRQHHAPPYPDKVCETWRTIDADTLLANLPITRVVDARPPERFRGEIEPLDPVAGHIPGAHNHPFTDNLSADGRFLDADTLRQRWAPLLGDAATHVVHQCGSGATACHNLLATAIAGWPLGCLYPGSWSEWCADPQRPVAQGTA